MSESVRRAESWARFKRMASERFPHGRVYGVRVVRGAVVSFERIRSSYAFGGVPARSKSGSDDQWVRFMDFCRGADELLIPEVHFRDGAPCLVQMEEPGESLCPSRPD